jgi:ubiquinone/menaquinone biosynthesis C-methylase UbiE
MGQDLNKIANAYDTVAKEYAEAFFGEHANKPMDCEMLRRFAGEIGDRQPVWDFGCGPGQTAQYLKSLGVEISGLDLSEKLLEQARTTCQGIHFQKGNMLALEFENNSIAGVVAFYSIVHFMEEQVRTAFDEIFRVLQPDGIFLLTFHVGDKTIRVNKFLDREVDIEFMFFREDFIIGDLKNSGFEKIEIMEREPYPGVEYQSKRAYVFTRKPGEQRRHQTFENIRIKI